MKLEVDLSGLWAAVKKMGSYESDFSLNADYSFDVDIDSELSSTQGLDIQLSDLETDNGVLSYAGRQVLLFIPDQGGSIDQVIAKPETGKRFHVADCSTLEDMKNKKRFERYKATYNVSGLFEVYGTSYRTRRNVKAEVGLKVCKNCLKHLNYKGYQSGDMPKSKIFNEFDIAEFLSEFSTLFRSMPRREDMVDEAGYSDDWREVSAQYRASVNYRCESCRVDLSEHRNLLHAHHINGNKRHNSQENLKALCADCHRKQPHHDYMRVSHRDMLKITSLRREQGLLESLGNWREVREMADKALDGLLRSYESRGVRCPEVGYEVQGADQAVVAELEIAWPAQKRAIAIDLDSYQAATALGWQVMTLGEALRDL